MFAPSNAQPDSYMKQSHLDMSMDVNNVDTSGLEDRVCPGCKQSVVSEQGGLIVAFGQSFFHVDCFKCAKCGDKVTADTNLLLLSDGSPICAKCSYSCNVCHLPILDEAIMTGDDSYHAHCFKCKVCKKRIDELVFAKTSQGIYCMDCHNERMIRIRKHNEKKAAAGGSSGSRRKDYPAASPSRPTFPDQDRQAQSSQVNTPRSQSSNPRSSPARLTPELDGSDSAVFRPPPRESSFHASEQARRQNTLPTPSNLSLPTSSENDRNRRKSYDDGTRPLDLLYQQGRPLAEPATSLKDKRRSFNPILTLGGQLPTSQLPIANSDTSRPLSGNSSSSSTSSHQESGTSSQVYASASQSTSSLPDQSNDPTITIHQPLGVESHPLSPRARGSSLNGRGEPREASPRPMMKRQSLPLEKNVTSNGTSETSQGLSMSRANPPFDVPSGVDEGDVDGYNDDRTIHEKSRTSASLPPSPPPKDDRPFFPRSPTSASMPDSDADRETLHDSSDDMSESSPVDQSTHTFIAPALPPIRISMNSNDFNELLNSVNGPPTLRSLPTISESEHNKGKVNDILQISLTPPLSSSSLSTSFTAMTPTSNETISSSTPTIVETYENEESLEDTLTPSNEDHEASFDPKSERSQPTIMGPVPHTRFKATREEKTHDLVWTRLREALADAKDRGAQQLKLDLGFVEAIVQCMEVRRNDYNELKNKFDGINRTSRQYINGLSVAQTEYDRELKARRDSEAEVTRLRVLLSGQAARLSVLSGDSRKHEIRQQISKELHENLSGLERDLSTLKVQRDMTIAEVEELSGSKSESPVSEIPLGLGRSLTVRFDKLKAQYQQELLPLSQERERLAREVLELKAARDVFLEETTVLNARNEELAQLSSQYVRRMDTVPEALLKTEPSTPQRPGDRMHITAEDNTDPKMRVLKPEIVDAPTPSKKFALWGRKDPQQQTQVFVNNMASDNKGKVFMEHNFQQLSILRLTRCDHCGEKMWGSQLRCSGCNMSVHTRCYNNVQILCTQQNSTGEEQGPPPPSMFGRELILQVHSDAKGANRQVPIIVEKCIEAVEHSGLEYEGLYRKTGGHGQSRMITQLFERGDYTFDLLDSDRFNDICSITSVLKSYFRSLPNPLLTFELHDRFMSAVEIKDPTVKHRTLLELVYKMPNEHYCTLRMLMLHLHRIFELSEVNLMNARNLGVVFGPTLMRSPNPNAEFSDMAGKALTIEWLVENAPQVFARSSLN